MLIFCCIILLIIIYSRYEEVTNTTAALQEQLSKFRAKFKQDIRDVIERTPLTVKERKCKVDLDAETPGTEALPPPLIPLAPESSSCSNDACTTENIAAENLSAAAVDSSEQSHK